ncbi:hypothetical protein NQZ68_014260 [Dissostichus eleginoides]|nr:hypothetical protein NQZ68_014260 [Dissostichus eleginoides]
MLGHPGERGDYQEINSKTGLALLTSQGSVHTAVPPRDTATNTAWCYCGFSVKETQREQEAFREKFLMRHRPIR